MDPLEPTVPTRGNMPVMIVLLVGALIALAVIFAWPW
jgi:hypothetical protein